VDKIKRNQIYLMIVGLFLLFMGFYLLYLRVNYTIPSLVSLSGITLLISGLRYKERLKYRKKLTGEERKKYLASNYFITSMIGTVILFSGLVGAELANYMHAKSLIVWFLVIFVVGMLVLFAGRIVKAVDKTEKSPA
jgi:small neutral amino acid transporter SnatA (MarC family)